LRVGVRIFLKKIARGNSKVRTAHACKAHGRARHLCVYSHDFSSSSSFKPHKNLPHPLLSLNLHFSSTFNLTYLHQNSTNPLQSFTQTIPNPISNINIQTKPNFIHSIQNTQFSYSFIIPHKNHQFFTQTQQTTQKLHFHHIPNIKPSLPTQNLHQKPTFSHKPKIHKSQFFFQTKSK
jgi:hypothetical protein